MTQIWEHRPALAVRCEGDVDDFDSNDVHTVTDYFDFDEDASRSSLDFLFLESVDFEDSHAQMLLCFYTVKR